MIKINANNLLPRQKVAQNYSADLIAFEVSQAGLDRPVRRENAPPIAPRAVCNFTR